MCVGVCGLNLMRRSINFAGTHSSHSPLCLATLSLPLNSFQYLQRNECVIIPSRHDPILSPLSLCFSPCPTQSSHSHLPYLFIYLLSCLFIVLPLIAFVVSWPRDVASIFDFPFAFRIRPLSFMAKKLKLILFDM